MRKKRPAIPSKETAGKESNDPLHTGGPWPASDQTWAGLHASCWKCTHLMVAPASDLFALLCPKPMSN